VSYINEEFNIKQLDLTHQKEGYIELRSYNPKYPTFRINEDDHFRVWGVVVYTIKKWK
jgi:DNA polymerase V